MSLMHTGANIAPTSSKKRKVNAPPKFYAVKAGHIPGVYTAYKDCEKNVTGFKGALFKSFPSQVEAEAFVAGRHVPISAHSSKPTRFYGVAVGKTPGVYTEWSEAQAQVAGCKGPKYKKFGTRREAEDFVLNFNDPQHRSSSNLTTPLCSNLDPDRNVNAGGGPGQYAVQEGAEGSPPSKKRRLGEDSQTVFSSQVQQSNSVHPRAEPVDLPDVLVVFTDGSSMGNGQAGARAGVGVFFGPGDERNVEEPLAGEAQTNQRAELTAILRALQILPTDRKANIWTDSQYSINCVTKWYQRWESNSWQTSLKQPVVNKDLVQAILAKIRERKNAGTTTDFTYVKGHANVPGNEAADRLAVRGAMMSRGRL